MKKAFERFWKFIIGPQYKRVLYTDPQYKYPNYPAPGSDQIEKKELYNYKRPFKESTYQIRYQGQEPNPIDGDKYSFGDQLNQTVEEKLYELRLLKKQDMKNSQEVEKAKVAFKKIFGEDIKINQYVVDDFELSQLGKNQTREKMSEFVKQLQENVNEDHRQEKFYYNLEENYQPNLTYHKTYNPSMDDPVYRQLRLDIDAILEKDIAERKQKGYQEQYEGDVRFWRAISNTNRPETIKQIQESIKDQVSNLDKQILEEERKQEQEFGKSKLKYPIKSNLVE